MNKLFALAASAAAMILSGPADAADSTCTAAPSCTDLGYTQFSTACSGKYIKCPFDTSKVMCVNGGPHVGDLKYSLESENHDGWLRCDGTQYKQNNYPELYKLIGTKFCHKYTSRTDVSYTSSKCNSGYFAVPDYRGFFLRGLLNTNYSAIDYKASRYSNALFYKGNYEGSTGTASSTPWAPQYEQLPNIKGQIWARGGVAWQNVSGAFYLSGDGQPQAGSNRDAWELTGLNFSASNSSSIYDGSHVSPAYYSAYIFIYAGE